MMELLPEQLTEERLPNWSCGRDEESASTSADRIGEYIGGYVIFRRHPRRAICSGREMVRRVQLCKGSIVLPPGPLCGRG